MAALHILKYSGISRTSGFASFWAENPYFQYFCGEEFFQHTLVFDRSSLTRGSMRFSRRALRWPRRPERCSRAN